MPEYFHSIEESTPIENESLHPDDPWDDEEISPDNRTAGKIECHDNFEPSGEKNNQCSEPETYNQTAPHPTQNSLKQRMGQLLV